MVPILALSVVPALFILIGVIVWLGTRAQQARLHAQAEFQKNLLDKFGSGQEFAAFLESEGSQKFLEQLWSPQAGARQRLLKKISIGVIFSTLGLGLSALAFFAHDQRGLIVTGVIFLALGVGFLISAFISNRLLKQWGESAESGALHT